MDIIFVLIPLSLLLLGVAVWAFFWAVRSRQFDNLDAEAWRILLDGDRPAPPESPKHPGQPHPGHPVPPQAPAPRPPGADAPDN